MTCPMMGMCDIYYNEYTDEMYIMAVAAQLNMILAQDHIGET